MDQKVSEGIKRLNGLKYEKNKRADTVKELPDELDRIIFVTSTSINEEKEQVSVGETDTAAFHN